MKFGIIGTNFITERFLEGTKEIEEFHLEAIYSRTEEKGRRFAEKYGVSKVYTSLEAMAGDPEVDAVYIASPNYCHARQSICMLEGHKHVLCEKPAVLDSNELKMVEETAERNHVVFMEGMRPVHAPGFEKLQEAMTEIGQIRGADLIYCQYSSRYDKFKNGVIENAFNPALGNAALMDIGVYGVHVMVGLFGMPDNIEAESVFLENGMEGDGTLLAGYGQMNASVRYSKICDSHRPSEIRGEKGTILFWNVPDVRKIEVQLRTGDCHIYEIEEKPANMYYETVDFMNQINGKKMKYDYLKWTKWEIQVMDQARNKAQIVFN